MSLEEFTREQRVKKPRHHIDAGFINHRQIFSIVNQRFRDNYEQGRIKQDDHMSRLLNNHLLVSCLLSALHSSETLTLGEILHRPVVGALFCSTEQFAPNEEVYDARRTRSSIILPYDSDWAVSIEYSTKHIVADTGLSELHQGGHITVAAGIRRIEGNHIIAYPLVMGAPSFDHLANHELGIDLMWNGWEWFEIFPGDIDEFSSIENVDEPSIEEWQNVMSNLPENEVKTAICEILNDPDKKDWGGELNDHFSSSMHLSGERISGAFLLKGPSDFREMTPRHLGKNADQIYRLSCAPANLLIVQHSHTIGEAVRATLRAFAVNPANPRRYCFIDGKDTYKLLKAYGKLPR